MRLAKSIWREKAKALVGGWSRALVVAPGVARLPSQAPDVDGVTYFEMPEDLAVGDFVPLRITGVRGFDFEGSAI